PPIRGRTGRASLYGRFPWASPSVGPPTRHRLPVRRIAVRGFACDGMRAELPLGASWTVSRRCYFLCHRRRYEDRIDSASLSTAGFWCNGSHRMAGISVLRFRGNTARLLAVFQILVASFLRFRPSPTTTYA